MPTWTHLIRFIAQEDHQIHIGQLVDTTRDIGLDTLEQTPIKAYQIIGSIFDGRVTETQLTVLQVSLLCLAKSDVAHQTHSQLLSPVDRDVCSFIRCLGLNYSDHAAEAKLPLPQAPILFAKPRTALMGPYPAAINVPKVAQDGTSDYEAELCLVIGKDGRDIPEEEALDYVLGYTASNDVSARTLQMLTPQWSFSKGLDSSCPIGEHGLLSSISNPSTDRS